MTPPVARETAPAIHLVASHLTPTLGLERAVLNLSNLLAESGFQTTIHAYSGTESDVLSFASARFYGGPARGWQRLDLRKVLRVRAALPEGATVILAGLWAALPYLILGRDRARRIIIWEHSLISEKICTSRSLRFLSNVARWLYKRADSVVAVSSPLALELSRDLGLPRVRTIANPLTESTPEYGAASVERTTEFVLVGSLTSTKNQGLAIEAIANLRHTDLKLILIGDGPQEARLRQLAIDLGVAEIVEFTGHVAADEVARRMQRAIALVHTAFGETFGYVYFEAAESNTPVIAVRNLVSSELIPEYVAGKLVEPTAGALADAMASVATSPPTATEFRRAAHARDARFAREVISRAWTDLLS